MSLPKVFMIGWEFPPYNSGGLGTACKGLTEALYDQQVPQILTLPKRLPLGASFLEFSFPDDPLMTQLHINMAIKPYSSLWFDHNHCSPETNEIGASAGSSMIDDAYAYARSIGALSARFDFDVIHSHDWMTYPAAFAAQNLHHQPVVLHVHSIEYDRTLNGHINPAIAKIEQESLAKAQHVITVSDYTKQMVIAKYGIPARKIRVIHNGVDLNYQRGFSIPTHELDRFAQGRKVVVFMGRLTSQKGPDYFVQTAQRIAQAVPNALFVVAGSGDMYQQVLLHGAAHQLTGKVIYTGFLRDRQKEFLYRRADLFIMPSVSEPFGIVALEAAAARTPVIISKQSGVSEVMHSAIAVDFWDVEQTATHAIHILQNPAHAQQLAHQSAEEVKAITWAKAAGKCLQLYQDICPQ